MLTICYPPGARGDFLASILLDTIGDCYKNYVIGVGADYQKVHWCKDLIGKPCVSDISIRVRLNNINDFLTVAHLWQQKILDDPLPTENILLEIIQNEFDARNLDHLFDYVVDFASLFDVDAIQKLYQDIHNKELDAETIKKIQHNISLQQRVSTVVPNL